MNRMKATTVMVFAMILATIGIGVGVSACDDAEYATPASYSVMVNGRCYVGWFYDPYEVSMLTGVPVGCTPILYPSYAPTVGDAIRYALWTHLLTYDSWYHSPYYYDRVLSPMSIKYHVTVVTRSTFVSYSHDFDTRNAKAIKIDSNKAKWSNGKSGSLKLPKSTSTGTNKFKPYTNSGNRVGTSNSNSRSTTTRKSGGFGSGFSKSSSGFGSSRTTRR